MSATSGKSLREIQEEEARRLEKELKEKNKQKAALAATTPLATAATWGAKSGGWANDGAWGNSTRKWDAQSPPTKSNRAINRYYDVRLLRLQARDTDTCTHQLLSTLPSPQLSLAI